MSKVIVPQISIVQVSDSPESHNKALPTIFVTEKEKDELIDEDLIFFDGTEWKCFASNVDLICEHIGKFVAILNDHKFLIFQFGGKVFTIDLSNEDITEYTDSITTPDGTVWDINFDNYNIEHFSFRVIPLTGECETLEVDADAKSIEFFVSTKIPTISETPEEEDSPAEYKDPWMGMTLGEIVKEFKDGGDKLTALEVDKLIDILVAKINLAEGNISKDQYEKILG